MSGLPPSDGAVLYGLPAFWVPDAFQSRVIYIQVLPAITTMARMRTDVTISERVAPPGALPVGSRISRTPREHHSLRTPIHRMMFRHGPTGMRCRTSLGPGLTPGGA